MLRALSKKLERSRLHRGYIQRILHARVPILKFVWAETGVAHAFDGTFQANTYTVPAKTDCAFCKANCYQHDVIHRKIMRSCCNAPSPLGLEKSCNRVIIIKVLQLKPLLLQASPAT